MQIRSLFLTVIAMATVCAAGSASFAQTGEMPTDAMDCRPIEGFAESNLTTRFIIFGEMHGTREIPALFGRAVCQQSERRPVAVALEIEPGAQPFLDDYLSSAGTASDRDKLLQSPIWNVQHADGRSSLAILDLLEQLRRGRAEGRKIDVVASRPFLTSELPSRYTEILIAAQWVQAADRYPDASVLVLVGNLHASKSYNERLNRAPAASYLPSADVTSLQAMTVGGTFWGCVDACGINEIGPITSPSIEGVLLNHDTVGFDGSFTPKHGLTASAPAKSNPG